MFFKNNSEILIVYFNVQSAILFLVIYDLILLIFKIIINFYFIFFKLYEMILHLIPFWVFN